MTGIHTYSTTASENITANTGINWDEGMPPASVNNSARQNMADIRGRWNDASWFQYGVGSKTVAATYASGTSFTLAGVDATAYWTVKRRVKAVGTGTGTIYGSVSSNSFGASTTIVNITWDSGSLSNETLTIYASTTEVTGKPLALACNGDYAEVPWTPSVGGSATYTTQTGTYTRVGRTITFRCSLTINVIGSGATSTVTGLTFPAAALTSVSIGFFANLAISVTALSAYISGSSIILSGLTAAASSITDNLAALGNSTRVEISGSYQI